MCVCMCVCVCVCVALKCWIINENDLPSPKIVIESIAAEIAWKQDTNMLTLIL